MNEGATRAGHLALLTALAGLLLGAAALWFGVMGNAIALWGFGAACLLQIPPALSLRFRIRAGLGNRGLEGERLTLRSVSHLQRLLALGLGLASLAALMGGRAPQASLPILGGAALAAGMLAAIWSAKQGLKGIHPALELDAALTRTLLELSALLVAGCLLGFWFPWADAASGFMQALRLFLAGRSLAKATTVPPACGGCGSGCC